MQLAFLSTQRLLSGRCAVTARRELRGGRILKWGRVLLLAVSLFFIHFFILSGRYVSDDDLARPHWMRRQRPVANCTETNQLGEAALVDSVSAEHPEALAWLEKSNARVTTTRLFIHQTYRHSRFWYVNETGIWSLESRVDHHGLDGHHKEDIVECGRYVPKQCQTFSQNSHVDEKNWYTSSRTAQQVMTGLRENARMLSLIQSLSGAQFVVMYGSLIGQWWNGQSLPWDTDIDVHILKVEALQSWLVVQERMKFPQGHSEDNLEVVYYKLPDANFTICFDSGPQHHIEFRLIHIPTGVYTDIMSISLTSDPNVLAWRVQSRPAELNLPAFAMKASFNKLEGGNLYNEEDVVPLSPCEFNGALLFCPRNVQNVLRQKYPHFDDVSWYQMNKKALFNQTIGLSGCWEESK